MSTALRAFLWLTVSTPLCALMQQGGAPRGFPTAVLTIRSWNGGKGEETSVSNAAGRPHGCLEPICAAT